MATYLIDYENTGVKGLLGIEQLKEDDLIIIFYGPKTGAVPFDEHVKICQAASQVKYIKTTKTAKNYLDFQLTTYLGYLVGQTDVKEYYVISKDSGYDSVIDFWKKWGIRIVRKENIAGQKIAAKTAAGKAAGKQKTTAKATKQASRTTGGKNQTAQPDKQEMQENSQAENQIVQDEKQAGFENAQNIDAVTTHTADNVADNNTADNSETDKNEAAFVQKEQVKVAVQNVDTAEQPDQEVSTGQPKTRQENSRKTDKEIAQASVAPEKPVRTNVPESVKKKVRQKLKGESLHAGVYRQIYGCMLQAQDKQTLNMALVKTFKQENGNHFYKLIQPVFTEWLKAL
ncbi:hypothetical protein KQI22_09775 [Kineothrix sp. MSJ-39]|uniref:PIN domain-containing protein n=1 Tax=Kineothrix sp. MSJ-39 TaxID=2841533 RepID=UPI001C125F30|nr:PIN domain-containing protein [Kineothrix sp. MSJ-39]MBU5430347.1 hypothetical protein [Kineothrix sp. MSJ-39]